MSTHKHVGLMIILTTLPSLGGNFPGWGLSRLNEAVAGQKRPSARLQVSSQALTVVSDARPGFSSNPELVYRRIMKTQMLLMKSRQVIHSALQQPRIATLDAIKGRDDPVAWLLDHLEVTNPEDSEVLEVALSASSAASEEDQAKLVNAVVHSYLDVVVNRDRTSRTHRLETLGKLSNTYRELMRSRRETLRRLTEKTSSDEERSLNKEMWPRLYQDLGSMQIRLRVEQAGAESLLVRRKKAEDAATELSRKEIAQIEDQLACWCPPEGP